MAFNFSESKSTLFIDPLITQVPIVEVARNILTRDPDYYSDFLL